MKLKISVCELHLY